MLPAISDLLKGTLDESLKKLVQPSGLVPAAILLLLNMLLVVLPLSSLHYPAALGFMVLADGWKVVIILVLLLVLSYLLTSLNPSIVSLLSGGAWINSPIIARWLIDRQKRRLNMLKAKTQQKETDPTKQIMQLRTKWEQMTTFPEEDAYIHPTALGNVMNAISGYIWKAYGIDMTGVWPQMEVVVAKDEPLAKRIDDRKSSMDLMLHLSFIMFVFTIEFTLLQVWLKQWDALWAIGWLGLAYGFYRVGVSRTRTWGDSVQIAFDIHREDLRQKLGVRAFKNQKDEHAVWQLVSHWLLWGERSDDIFQSQVDPPPVVLTSSGNIQVFHESCLVDERFPQQGAAASLEFTLSILYTLILTNSSASSPSSACPAEGVSVIVNDSRVPSIETKPQVLNPIDWQGIHIDATILPTGGSPRHKLLWTIERIPPHGSRILRYMLPLASFKASIIETQPVSQLVTIQTDSLNWEDIQNQPCVLRLRNASPVDISGVTIDIRDTQYQPSNKAEGALSVPDDEQTRTISPQLMPDHISRWQLDKIKITPGNEFGLSVNLSEPSTEEEKDVSPND